MATVNSVINKIKDRPADISKKFICMQLSELDKKISQELMQSNDFVPYRFPEDAEKELIIKSPHDNIYYLYIIALIDFLNGELAEYSASALLFEQAYSEYRKTLLPKGADV